MSGEDERRSHRTNVVLMGVIRCGAVCVPVRVSNLSAHGALVVGDLLPAVDARVAFECNGITIQSCVAWTRDRHAGIQFAEAVEPESLRRNAPLPHPVITRDTRHVTSRRPGFRGNQMTDEERDIVEEWQRSQNEKSTATR